MGLRATTRVDWRYGREFVISHAASGVVTVYSLGDADELRSETSEYSARPSLLAS